MLVSSAGASMGNFHSTAALQEPNNHNVCFGVHVPLVNGCTSGEDVHRDVEAG